MPCPASTWADGWPDECDAVPEQARRRTASSSPSKTAHRHCWAWWIRRADDYLGPSGNDPYVEARLR